jgi:hypothetical protein
MSAELLRRAADQLRDLASTATKRSAPPWWHHPGRPSDSVRTEAGWEVMACTYPDASADLAKYAALMHPPVALALADWLDDTAPVMDMFGTDEQARKHAERYAEYALAVARAVLREPDPNGGQS